MTIKSRLTALKSQAGALPAQPAAAHAAVTLRGRLSHLRPERVHGASARSGRRMSEDELARAVGGELIGDGLIRIERAFRLSETIGNASLSGLGRPPLLPGETQRLPSVYFDTETTGLSGGSGTLAFLIGFAHAEGEEIRLTQLLMVRFSAEPVLLSLLRQLLPSGHRLVSYNGKSYDLPLLISRFRMQGMKPDLAEIAHLDLLHPVRRLFTRCWDDCRLTTAEKNLLGFHRLDDLPGAEAPAAWFSYVRAGDGERLIKVIAHNRQDILSLAAIHSTLADTTADPPRQEVDIHALARWLLEFDKQRALELLKSSRESLCDDGKQLLARLSRSAGKWHDAVPLWEELADKGCSESVERLAKYHEHIRKDLETALRYCNMLPGSLTDRHRYSRIHKKLSATLP